MDQEFEYRKHICKQQTSFKRGINFAMTSKSISQLEIVVAFRKGSAKQESR